CTLFSRLDSSFLLCDILKPVGFHIEEIHGLCCAFFYSAFIKKDRRKKLYVVITILTNIPIGAAELLHKAFL
ncbi:hypothetical protein, partial [Ruminococcus bicirculans (ex Wegman et al. 2014)]|uniref:hypothetical protein n=1 Tax=Ruminococcus bicirculans (ex Wegman et al. 2014) TaxID=1160721 RepID=UPI003FEDC23D